MDTNQMTVFQRFMQVLLSFIKLVGIFLLIPVIMLITLPLWQIIVAFISVWGIRVDLNVTFVIAYILGLLFVLWRYIKYIKNQYDYNYLKSFSHNFKLIRLPAIKIILLFILGLSMQPTQGLTLAYLINYSEFSFLLLPLVLISVLILEPLVQEFMFRGILSRKIKSHFNVVGLFIIHSVFYAIFNVNPFYIIYGAIFLLVVLWTGSLYAGIITHVGKNFYFLLHNWFNPGEYVYNPNIYLFVIFLVILLILFKTRSYDALDNENPYYKYDEILDDEYEAV